MVLNAMAKKSNSKMIDVSPRSSTSIGTYPKSYCQEYLI